MRHHLVMSDTAQKRDISDPRTVSDFAKQVQSPQRLRLLLVLTVCDIRGVGPGVWNNWKAQLLRELYWDARDVLTGGAGEESRRQRIDAARTAMAERLADWPAEDREAEIARHYAHFWLGLDTETHALFAELARETAPGHMASRFLQDEERGVTKACLYMGDHPGLFSRMAGAIALAGADVVDARSYTTNDGMATSVFWIQDGDGHPFETDRLPRLRQTIERTLGKVVPRKALEERHKPRRRERTFTVPTRIVFDNDASDLYTVIEVNARDRLGLLNVLARALADLNINIFTAIIATYGEHAVDVFYVKDLFGLKIRSKSKFAQIERRLSAAVEGTSRPEGTTAEGTDAGTAHGTAGDGTGDGRRPRLATLRRARARPARPPRARPRRERPRRERPRRARARRARRRRARARRARQRRGRPRRAARPAPGGTTILADTVPTAAASRPIRLLMSFLTVGGWTMASRLLGFIRDVMIAGLLGAGPVAEAFFVAFRLPNMFRRFFAEGAFNMAFVPMFAKKVEGEGEDAARAFGREAQSVLFAALVVLTVLAEIAMPWFVVALASGFDGPTFELAVLFSRIGFPYILFISLCALYSGVLNSFGRFAAAAAAPTLLNIALIAAMLLAWWQDLDVGLMLTWSELVAGIAQFLLVLWAAQRIGMALGLQRPRLTPEVRRLVRIGVPAVLAGGVVQINLVVGTQVASYFDGAVAWLSYADRLYQLPLGVVGVAIGVVLLPELSRRFRAGDMAGTREAMNRATEFTLVLTVPSAVALVAIPALICRVLYERGAFDALDTANTALALSVYAVGLPAFVMQKVLQPAFFAREDTMTPLRYAALSMLVNVGVAVGLAPVLGFVSAALGTTLAGWLNLVLLWRGVRRLGGLEPDPRLRRRLPRILVAAGVMGALALALAELGQRWHPELPGLALAAIVVLAMATYAFLSLALGAFALSDIRAATRPSRS